MRDQILEAARKQAEGEVAVHKTNGSRIFYKTRMSAILY